MIKCGHCGGHHHDIERVYACSLPEGSGVGICDWLIDTQQYDEDGGKVIIECGAEMYVTRRGTTCQRGHENVSLEVQWREGWAYVTEDEAAGFQKNTGRRAVLMDGHVWVG